MKSHSYLLWPLGKVLYHMAFVSPFSGKNSRTDSYSFVGMSERNQGHSGESESGETMVLLLCQGSSRGEVLTGMAGLGELTSVNILTDSVLWHCLFS